MAHLTLDKVVKWSPPEPAHDHLETVVRYTYHVKAADWMSEPEAQKVFPDSGPDHPRRRLDADERDRGAAGWEVGAGAAGQ